MINLGLKCLVGNGHSLRKCRNCCKSAMTCNCCRVDLCKLCLFCGFLNILFCFAELVKWQIPVYQNVNVVIIVTRLLYWRRYYSSAFTMLSLLLHGFYSVVIIFTQLLQCCRYYYLAFTVLSFVMCVCRAYVLLVVIILHSSVIVVITIVIWF